MSIILYDNTYTNPAQISGLVYRLSALVPSSITMDGSNAVSQWNDLSPSPANATQAFASAQPIYTTNSINGRPAIVFDGSNDALSAGTASKLNLLPGTDSFTVVVFHKNATNEAGTFISKAAATAAQRQYQFVIVTNTLSTVIGGTTKAFSSTVTGGNGKMIITTVSTSAVNNYVDNVADAGNPGTIGSATLSLSTLIGARRPTDGVDSGSASNYKGALGEILVYNKVLSAAEMTQLKNYSTTAWGM